MKLIAAWWFFGDALRDGRRVPADGEWLVHDGPLKLCVSGLHASDHPFDALQYAPGPWLAKVELSGKILRDGDKLCARKRRIVQRLDATDLLDAFARDEASRVLHLWDAPPVVRDYLATGDTSLGSAALAAWSAANAARDAALAAWSAAMAATDAACAAARAAANAARAAAWAAAGSAAWAAAWAAGDAAGSAAWAAAWAAGDAAWSAGDAARAAAMAAVAAAQRDRFAARVTEAFAAL